jgi:hypothetical protein
VISGLDLVIVGLDLAKPYIIWSVAGKQLATVNIEQ